ncbi:MAG: U32 family peptidase, partial [Oscillospiraceae bacterium]|nr:U32 family peptidase [Oscillospiraceae bacterium]
MLHLLAPAGSSEAVIAAVQNGADMVYMEYGATAGEGGMSREELSQSIRYCRVRGCGAAVTMDQLLTEQELPEAVKRAVYAAEQGAEAILVRDLGLIYALRHVLPEVELWGSVRMGVHSLDGAMTAAALGLRRITLAPELDLEQIHTISSKLSIETAVCVHGPVCFSYSGQCYMSAMNGQGRSDSRLRCGEPCRERLSLGGRMDEYPLSTADRCL